MYDVETFRGECPPYNDLACWVGDPFEGKAYTFGGQRPEETNNLPTSDFYCLDTTSMTWKNLTRSLKFRTPNAPMSRDECRRDTKELPELSLPACTLLRLHNTSFLLIFGGFDVNEKVAGSSLIIINLRYHEWWIANIQGGPVAGRIDPTIVSINTSLYIFGGYRSFVGDGNPHSSYSIAKLSEDGGTWNWEARDVPYSEIPRGIIFGRATPVYNGSKILLTPWRTIGNRVIDFTNQNIFCFHIARQKFQSVDFTDDFPTKIQWYFTYPLDASFNPDSPSVSTEVMPKRRGRPRKRARIDPPPSETFSTPSQAIPSPSSSLTSSVLICGWVEGNAELWRLEVTASEKFTKLNIGRLVPRLQDYSLEGSMLLGHQFWLLGSRTAMDMDSNSDSDSDDENAITPTYDIYLNLPLSQF